MTQSQVLLEISRDEALVLYEWLARFEEGTQPAESAETHVRWKLEGQLEKLLAELFVPNYHDVVEEARKRILAGKAG